MLTYDNGGLQVQDASELPEITDVTDLYLDLETTSGNPKLTSLNPWHDCDLLGICLTVDDWDQAIYVPISHVHGQNVDREAAIRWLKDTARSAKRWINHNVKYDAHVSANYMSFRFDGEIVDTVTLGKIIDSDRIFKGGYSLEALSKAWLHEDISHYKKAFEPYLHKNKDYGHIPADIMAPYGCQDVLTGRRLFHYENHRCPDMCRDVWATEIALTELLFRIERRGLHVHPQELAVTELKTLHRMLDIESELEQIVGRGFRPHTNDDCFDVLCNQYGLPVLAWTDTTYEDGHRNPSFDANALRKYAVHPYAPKDVVDLMLEYRHLNTLNNLFLKTFQREHINGVLHSDYNQCIRTGRMSCSRPNAQQQSGDSKKLIHPAEGHTFISADASQIEFRTIVHYIKDEEAIAAYAADPDTDFHQWVADLCEMPRRPAKNVNFATAFGQGKAGLIDQLSADETIVGDLKRQIDEKIASGEIDEERAMALFEGLCVRRAEKVYTTYHSRLPGVKRTSRRAESALRQKGYVFNLRGRHRHIPLKRAHIAFNTINQSSAADIVKERMVALDALLRGCDLPVYIVAQVHDEILMEAPTELVGDPLLNAIINCLEHPDIELRVPLRWAVNTSAKNWKEAASNTSTRHYGPDETLENLKF